MLKPQDPVIVGDRIRKMVQDAIDGEHRPQPSFLTRFFLR